MPVTLNPVSPDPNDPSKFVLGDRVARPIHHYDGWYVPIDLDWCNGTFEEPRIHGADAGYPLMGERVRSLVVAYETGYQRAVDLAGRYEVALRSVEPERVLAVAG